MSTANLQLTVVYQRDGERWWTAQIPEVPGAVSHGRTKKEAKESALIALALVLQGRRENFLREHDGLASETLKLAA